MSESVPGQIVFSTDDTKYLLLNILGHDVIHDFNMDNRYKTFFENNSDFVKANININTKRSRIGYGETYKGGTVDLELSKKIKVLNSENFLEMIKIQLIFYFYSFLFNIKNEFISKPVDYSSIKVQVHNTSIMVIFEQKLDDTPETDDTPKTQFDIFNFIEIVDKMQEDKELSLLDKISISYFFYFITENKNKNVEIDMDIHTFLLKLNECVNNSIIELKQPTNSVIITDSEKKTTKLTKEKTPGKTLGKTPGKTLGKPPIPGKTQQGGEINYTKILENEKNDDYLLNCNTNISDRDTNTSTRKRKSIGIDEKSTINNDYKNYKITVKYGNEFKQSFLNYIKRIAFFLCDIDTNPEKKPEKEFLQEEINILSTTSYDDIDKKLIDFFYNKYDKPKISNIIKNNQIDDSKIDDFFNTTEKYFSKIQTINNKIQKMDKKFIINNAASIQDKNLKKYVFCPISSTFDAMKQCNYLKINSENESESQELDEDYNEAEEDDTEEKLIKNDNNILTIITRFSKTEEGQEQKQNIERINSFIEEIKTKNKLILPDNNQSTKNDILEDEKIMNFSLKNQDNNNNNIYYNGGYDIDTNKINIKLDIQLPKSKIYLNQSFPLGQKCNIVASNILINCLNKFLINYRLNTKLKDKYFFDIFDTNKKLEDSIPEYKYILLKGVGDLFQEINAVCINGAYSNPTYNPDIYDYNRSTGQPHRLFLANDRPSATRFIFMLTRGISGINRNAFGGYYPHNKMNALIATYDDNIHKKIGGKRKSNTRKRKSKSNTTTRKRKSHKKKQKTQKKTIKKNKFSRNF